jgi:hypothetical protein
LKKRNEKLQKEIEKITQHSAERKKKKQATDEAEKDAKKKQLAADEAKAANENTKKSYDGFAFESRL